MSENVGFVEISNDCTISRNDGTARNVVKPYENSPQNHPVHVCGFCEKPITEEPVAGIESFFHAECADRVNELTAELENHNSTLITFESGAVRYPTGRRYDLMSPQAVRICMPHSSVSILIDLLLFFLVKEAKHTLTTRQLCENLCQAMFHVIGNPSLSELLDLYAQALDEGSKKYGDRNWEKGIPESNLVNHAISHAIKIEAGDTSEDHVSHLIWNVFAIIHFRLKDSTD